MKSKHTIGSVVQEIFNANGCWLRRLPTEEGLAEKCKMPEAGRSQG